MHYIEREFDHQCYLKRVLYNEKNNFTRYNMAFSGWTCHI
jgi:hypothetical protein